MNPNLSACVTRSVHLVCCFVVLLLSLQSLQAQSLEELWTVEVGPFGHDVSAVEFFPDGEKFAVVWAAPAAKEGDVKPCFVEIRLVEDGSLVASLDITEYFNPTRSIPRSLDISSDGTQIAVSFTHLVLWNWESDEVLFAKINGEERACNADRTFYKDDDSMVAVIGPRGVYLVNVETLSIDYEVTFDMLGESIFNAYITPDFKSIGALLNTSRRTAIIYVEEEKIDISLFDLGLQPVVSHDGQFVYSFEQLELDNENYNYFLVKHDANNMVLKSEYELDGKTTFPARTNITVDDKYVLYCQDGEEWFLIDAASGEIVPVYSDESANISGVAVLGANDELFISYPQNKLTMFGVDLRITDVGNESASESSISVFPNPSTKGFSVGFEGFSTGRMNVALMSMLGETLLRKEIITESQQGVIELTSEDLSRIGSGQYLLTLAGQDGEQASTAVVLE